MRLLYITNIPAPYRQERFNTMAKIFPDYGIDFEVLYMAKIEPNRQWLIADDSYQYRYKIFKGVHPIVGGFFAHFNPGLLLRLLKNDYDLVVVGGMAGPTHWLAPYFVGRSKYKVMSIESNMQSVTRTKGLGAWIKSVLLNTADAYQVTGDPQIEYINFFQPQAKNRRFIRMPNLIDEDVYGEEVQKLRARKDILRKEFGVLPDEQMWVIPARLIPIKGILPFVEGLKGLKGFRLFLLGDGEQTGEIYSLISTNNLPVTLVGFVQQETVIRYYAAADLFILPSFKDPSPLTPIEAIAAGLPLLVSQNIGNLNEVLGEKNGWSFEPGDQKSVHEKLKAILSLTRDDLQTKGDESKKQFLKYFETEMCVHNYAKQLLETFKND